MTELAVEVRGLRKRYGELTAVDGLDLEIRRGEVFGILGPNGARQEHDGGDPAGSSQP